MSQALTFTVLAAVAGVVAVLPVVYFEYRRVQLKRRKAEWRFLAASPSARENPDVESPELLELTSYPPEAEGRASVAALKRLSPCAIANLAALGYDEVEARSNDLPLGLPISPHDGPSFTEDELGALDYIATVDSPLIDDDRKWAVLTDSGRQLARILVASSESPQWLWDASGASPD